MTFPDKKYENIENYAADYFKEINLAASTVDGSKLHQAAEILTRAYTNGGMVYSCGNGGSAAIANHLVCDH